MRGTFARVPDSKTAREAAELVRLDREVRYIAAVLHDLALTERHDRGQRFEVDGAEAARCFLSGRGYPREKADRAPAHSGLLVPSLADALTGNPLDEW